MSHYENEFALKRADLAGIRSYVLKAKSAEERDEELLDVLKGADVELVVLADYIRLIGPKVIKDFTLINTYLSLLPKYVGRGMRDENVHMVVADNYGNERGVTLHFVNAKHDRSQIIYQTHVPFYPEDSENDILTRVQEVKKTPLVSILKAFTEGKIDIPDIS